MKQLLLAAAFATATTFTATAPTHAAHRVTDDYALATDAVVPERAYVMLYRLTDADIEFVLRLCDDAARGAYGAVTAYHAPHPSRPDPKYNEVEYMSYWDVIDLMEARGTPHYADPAIHHAAINAEALRFADAYAVQCVIAVSDRIHAKY